jgi:hypothetical protein
MSGSAAVLHNLWNIALGRLFTGSLLQMLVLRSNWRLLDVKSAKLRNTAGSAKNLRLHSAFLCTYISVSDSSTPEGRSFLAHAP